MKYLTTTYTFGSECSRKFQNTWEGKMTGFSRPEPGMIHAKDVPWFISNHPNIHNSWIDDIFSLILKATFISDAKELHPTRRIPPSHHTASQTGVYISIPKDFRFVFCFSAESTFFRMSATIPPDRKYCKNVVLSARLASKRLNLTLMCFNRPLRLPLWEMFIQPCFFTVIRHNLYYYIRCVSTNIQCSHMASLVAIDNAIISYFTVYCAVSACFVLLQTPSTSREYRQRFWTRGIFDWLVRYFSSQ